jgi:hypothetical protein
MARDSDPKKAPTLGGVGVLAEQILKTSLELF